MLTEAKVSGSSVSASATGALLVSQTSSLTGQSVTLTATTFETVWQSSVGATAGGVTLTAQGGDLTLLIATVTATGTTTGTSPDQVLVQNGADVSGNQGLGLTAGTNLSVTASTLVSSAGAVTLTANGGLEQINSVSSVTGDTGVSGSATGAVSVASSTIEAKTGNLTLTSDTAGTPGGGGIMVSGSTLTAGQGNVTLSSNGGSETIDPSTVSAGGSVTGTSPDDISISGSSSVATKITAGQNVSFTAGGALSVSSSSVTATAGEVTLNANGNLLVDAASSVNAATTITLEGGQGGAAADSITLDGSFGAPAGSSTTALIEVYGGNGGDTILLSPVAIDGYTQVWGGTGADTITLHLPSIDVADKFDPAACTSGATTCPQALVNGTAEQDALPGMSRTVQGVSGLPLRNMVDVDGGGGGDAYIVDMSGTSVNPNGTDYIIRIHDDGPPTDFNTLTINGAANIPNDFLLEQNYVADLQPGTNGTYLPDYERVNYDTTINLLHVLGGTAADAFNVDGNSAITVLDGVAGADTFQFGQLFGSQPTAAQDVALGDEIATVDTTSGFLSAGVNYATTAYAGTGNATFTVYSNKATLKLFGEGGNNTFIVQAFQIVNTSSVATSNTQINTGNGNNLVEYNINAPVAIDGGSGYNTLVVIGTEGNDTFVITKDGSSAPA